MNPAPAAPLVDALSAVFRPLLDDAVRQAREAAIEELAKRPGSAPLEIIINRAPAVTIDHAHSALPELVSIVAEGFNNLFICGPAGSGKTTLARDLARALSRPFSGLSLSAGVSESRLEGRLVPNLHDGTERYHTSESVRAYKEGGVILWDELDASDPNVLIVTNAAVGNGHWYLPNGEVVERHPDCVIVCAANTYGTGPDRMYVGRNQLDAATLDRFVGAIVDIDYDRKLEERILPNAAALARIWNVREKIAALKMRRLFGTRAVLAVAKMLRAGRSLDVALTRCTVGWTSDEKSRAGVL